MVFILLALYGQLALADSLYAHGHFDTARIEYLRCFFFYPELEQELNPRLKYAISVFAGDETSGTEELYGIVNDFPEMPDSVRAEIATKYIEAGRYYLAINLLENDEKNSLLGVAYLLDDQLINARNVFLRNGDYEMASKIEAFLQHPMKSEKTALMLSLVLPGSGQIYADNLSRGFVDFLVNLGSGYLFYNAIKQQKYVDASLIFLFLINRFYLGSLNNAQKSAIEHNEKYLREWRENVIKPYFEHDFARR
jgi:hypothetical protein